MKRSYFVLGLIAAITFTSCTKQIEEPKATIDEQQQPGTLMEAGRMVPPKTPHESYVANELLVKFVRGTSGNARSNALAHIAGVVKERVVTKTMRAFGDTDGFVVVHTPLAALDAVGKLRGGAEIVFAEPNYIYTHAVISTDSYFSSGSLWGMYGDASTPKNNYGSQAAEAWKAGHTGSKSVFVGIIDEGVQYTHPDLKGQIWTNPYEKMDGIDNDGNGYVDDIHGWDFAHNNNSVYDGGNTGSADSHGTHVSGTIGAKDNGAGVVGMNWYVTIIPCKFITRYGGTTADAVKAVDYLTDLKNRHGLHIVASNNSWNGDGYSQALYDAIQRANTKNILFIAAAGNGGSDGIGDNNDATPSYPASYTNSNIISVAAITSTGARASFSNYGYKSVDIGAPGVDIYSTVAYNGYASYSGTSMATPHVSGAAALYASTHPTATAAAIKAAILKSVVLTPSLNGKCVTGGRLNVSGF